MGIFQKSVLNKYLKNLDLAQVQTAYGKFQRFYGDAARLSNIELLKEESYQEGFLREIFVQVLGYTINPDPGYNLTTEFKNLTDSKKADGAILRNGEALGVIELKSTRTFDLERIKQQAFSYKNNQPACKYVITSNFHFLRFYIDNATEYEEFDLFELTETDFQKFYLLLAGENLLADVPEKMKAETKFHEENISDRFYKDYSAFKRKIFENLILNNPQYDKLTLFQKSQKLLDRLLFVFFAEDSGLVPPNAISRIIEQWNQLQDLEAYQPLYDRFKLFFCHLNTGHKYQTYELSEYNGGLFAPDEILDNVKIDDPILHIEALKLSTYDFSTEIDVNILGHIFEHSLAEIEEITAELEGAPVDRKQSKRKKEGIFYTPKYITQYIVENTVGALCQEKKAELGIADITIDESFRKKDGKISVKGKELFKILETYKEWLLSLKILDPACGSGAFLNQALEFLIAEHRALDGLIQEVTNEALGLFVTDKQILENNLYGVDLNEESVEIAKLSLWLRTARKGRQLSTLNENIKCGNSLIDDPAVAGTKAFSWEKEFPDIFAKGGFDVVIGNPPYGAALNKNEKTYLDFKYVCSQYNYDSYTFFFEKSIQVLKKNGLIGFITPNTFLVLENGDKLRTLLLLENKLISLLEIFNVFPDAIVEPIITILKKERPSDAHSIIVLLIDRKSKQTIDLDFKISKLNFSLKDIRRRTNLAFNYKETPAYRQIYNKIIIDTKPLKEFATVTTGIKPYQKGKGVPPQTQEIVDKKPFTSFKQEDKSWMPLIRGTQVNRYSLNWDNEYIKYGKWLAEPRTLEIFSNPKLFIRRTDDKLLTAYDDTGIVGVNSIHSIQSSNAFLNEKYLMCLLNSKLVNWIFQYENFHMVGKPFAEIKVVFVERLPIRIPEDQSVFIQKADKMCSLYQELFNYRSKFIRRLRSSFQTSEFKSSFLEFNNFDFNEFLIKLKGNKIKLTLKQQDEWEDYFNEYKTKLTALQAEIDQTDREINQMVYELYGLTPEEIKIVEESVR